jgi:hypothetical protein
MSGRKEVYVLAITGVNRDEDAGPTGEAVMKLICLRTGDRWSKGVVVGNCSAVTQGELKKIGSTGVFKLVLVGEITVQSVTYLSEKVRI